MSGEPTPILFVGVGPGDPGLLTLKEQRGLAEAQVVVFDAGLPAALLDLAPDVAERIAVAPSAPGHEDGASGVPRAAVPALLIARVAGGRQAASG